MRSATRREVLRAALVAAATGFVPGCRETSLGPPSEQLPAYHPGEPLPWRNWAGNQGCRPAARHAPPDESALAELFRKGAGVIRPVGTGHSFSALVPSDGTLVACDQMSGVLRTDPERLEAEAWAGTRLHQLGPALRAHGQAMPNLPDIDYQTLGGAVATSTHGTGRAFGSLSSYVAGLALVTPAGEVLDCTPESNPEVFHAARCSLGALGVVSRMTLGNQAPFELTETTAFEPLGDLLDDVEARCRRHRHFEFYAVPHTELAISIATDEGRRDPTPEAEFERDPLEAMREAYRQVGRVPFLGSLLYERVVRGVADAPPTVRSGPSYEVLTHPRIARFREMEYTVPADAGPACLREILAAIRRRAIPVVFPIEVRYVRSDDVWLSMFHGRDGCSISLHQFADEDHRAYFDVVEEICRRYEGRPHWGKLHGLVAEDLRGIYPRWKDFLEVREHLDPTGRMLNPHLREVFGVNEGTA